MVGARVAVEAKPAGYPQEYEVSVRLKDGRRVGIRPILPSDAPELADAIRTADAETLHARFLGGPPPITRAILDELTRLDYTNRFALVARTGRLGRGRGVAVARYAVYPPCEDGSVEAEVAIAVDPEWRRVGLATQLIALLARRAHECGIARFTAQFLAQNRPVVELAHDGNARVVIADGAARLSAAIPEPDEDPTQP